MNACIIVSAGSGLRFCQENLNSPLPKQYFQIGNRRILDYTLGVFIKEVETVIVVIRKEDEGFFRSEYPGVQYIIGGSIRQDSVRNGLSYLKENFSDIKNVLITDAVRPFASSKMIQNVLKHLNDGCTAVIPALKINEAVKQVKNGFVEKTIDREIIYTAQTPQGFDFKTIYNLHQKYKGSNFIDDSLLCETENLPIKIVDGEKQNIKITTIDDITYSSYLLKEIIRLLP